VAVAEIRVRSARREQMLDITADLRRLVEASGVSEGVVVLQSLHTTAALTLNESADPDVPRDLVAKLERLAPRGESFYRHAEGNSDAHLKTAFFGPSLTLLVQEGRPLLGQWQGVFLCEFDGPRERRVAVRVMAG
jgi:secondary thiamine-phosphate synthase enzyme